MFTAVLDLPTLTQGARIAVRLCILSMTQLLYRMARPHGPVKLLRRASGEETIETDDETILVSR